MYHGCLRLWLIADASFYGFYRDVLKRHLLTPFGQVGRFRVSVKSQKHFGRFFFRLLINDRDIYYTVLTITACTSHRRDKRKFVFGAPVWFTHDGPVDNRWTRRIIWCCEKNGPSEFTRYRNRITPFVSTNNLRRSILCKIKLFSHVRKVLAWSTKRPLSSV